MSDYKPFAGMLHGENLDGFHQRRVAFPGDETMRRNADVDQFVGFLQREFGQRPFTVSKVIKSGSLGKGTAVKGSADIDLVVFINGLSSIEDLKANRERLLDVMESKVKSYEPWRRRVVKQDRTSFSLCYTLDGQEVDILPAFDVIQAKGRAGVYRSMAAYPEGKKRAAQQYSASLAPLQIDFVKPKGEDVKRVIRLLKFWKKEEAEVDIRSYTLELITIHAARSLGCVTTKTLFQKVLRLLQDCANLRISFNDNYNSTDYERFWSVPYVIDPANPYMNTLHGVDEDKVSREATRTLRCL